MAFNKHLPIALGGGALASNIVSLIFEIIVATSIVHEKSTRSLLLVSFSTGCINVALLCALVVRQFQYRNGAHVQDFGHGRRCTYSLAGLAGFCGATYMLVSMVALAVLRSSMSTLPKHVDDLVVGALIMWAVSLVLQSLFLVSLVMIQRRDFRKQIQPYSPRSMSPSRSQAKLLSPTLQKQSFRFHEKAHRREDSTEPLNSPTTLSRTNSDAESSVKSSLSHVVRPITSKTPLNSRSQRSQRSQPSRRSLYRPSSMVSLQETIVSIDESFDSWDTSAVETQSRIAMDNGTSPVQSHRFLETIPASPTASRSPSPALSIDMEPPRAQRRGRSYSPAPSIKTLTRGARSPGEDSNQEAHIHPLFRSDSPAPPSITPGTSVHAAPGAGTFISDHASIRSVRSNRSIYRLRGESHSTGSPLTVTSSLESIGLALEREEADAQGKGRTMTPPLPDLILVPRPAYTKKKSQIGLGITGEECE